MNLTLQYDQVLFILEPTGIARSLARKRVTVIDYPDGRLAIRYNGVDLPYRTWPVPTADRVNVRESLFAKAFNRLLQQNTFVASFDTS